MREIKFRAWFAKDKALVPVDKLELFGETGHAEVSAKHDFEKGGWYSPLRESTHRKTVVDGSKEQVPRVVLMQYTGLKDKKGVEIFEGDIESDENGNLSVVCYLKKNGAYCFVPAELYVHEDYENQVKYSYGYDCYFHNATPSKYATVIGNIYENPELLVSVV